uniref:presenilin-like protein At1g08700 n=1 Tax=Erigeron canadensis TaxID=72917 RepID=UPI001CB8AEFD|nr:presenilin-like protein At1g08700 [Erigeron canadensis]
MDGSILESIGTEIIGVMSPVSICMLIVVLIVYSSSSSSSSVQPIRTAANLVYLETPSDSTSQKLEGSLLNAVVFVILIAAVTFLLVILYYYNFTNFLKNYMRFSAFFVLGVMGGSIVLSIIRQFSIPVDVITCVILLFNFTVVGVISVFAEGVPVPIIVRQVYMVVLGIIVAVWFTNLPEWTTWTLLVALAVYDLVAVLAPGGPLKILVELASSRDDELPALVYEARPTVSRNARGAGLGLLVAGVSSDEVEVEMSRRNGSDVELMDEETSPLVPSLHDRIRSSSSGSSEFAISVGGNADRFRETEIVGDEEERTPLSSTEPHSEEMTRGIKLGLGDFVFYSVLVGRAAMYDLMTVYACYLAIISGLGCTLVLLSVFRHALPALPISIALGIMFYFLTRVLMEPFVVGTSTNLMMF